VGRRAMPPQGWDQVCAWQAGAGSKSGRGVRADAGVLAAGRVPGRGRGLGSQVRQRARTQGAGSKGALGPVLLPAASPQHPSASASASSHPSASIHPPRVGGGGGSRCRGRRAHPKWGRALRGKGERLSSVQSRDGARAPATMRARGLVAGRGCKGRVASAGPASRGPGLGARKSRGCAPGAAPGRAAGGARGKKSERQSGGLGSRADKVGE
jgi:hypothetical protein